jgi:hypothetical protein
LFSSILKKLGPTWHRTGLMFNCKISNVGSIFKIIIFTGPASNYFGPVTGTVPIG